MGGLNKYHRNRDECIVKLLDRVILTPTEATTLIDRLFTKHVVDYIGLLDFNEDNLMGSCMGVELYFDIDPAIYEQFNSKVTIN